MRSTRLRQGSLNEKQRFGADPGPVVWNSINKAEFGLAQRFLERDRVPYRSRSIMQRIKLRSVERERLVFADGSPPRFSASPVSRKMIEHCNYYLSRPYRKREMNDITLKRRASHEARKLFLFLVAKVIIHRLYYLRFVDTSRCVTFAKLTA